MVADGGPSPIDATTTFEGFLADPGSQLALAACRQVAEAPGVGHNPLYLHGPAGTGKSHLLGAIAHHFHQLLGEGAAVRLRGPEFVAVQAQELAERDGGPLRQALEAAAVILVDDVDAVAGRDVAQEELFHLLNDALDRGVQVVVAGRLSPQRLTPVTERLASRLGWGLVLGLEPARLETRLAVVRRRGGHAAAGMDPVALASLVESRAPDLHAAVLLADHLAHHGHVAPPVAATLDRILAAVAARFGLRPADLVGKRRDREASTARGLALLLARRLAGHRLQELGGMVGGRDHTTVLHALKATEERLAADPALRLAYDELASEVVRG